MADKTNPQVNEVQQLRHRIAELENQIADTSPFGRDLSKSIIDASPAFFVIIDAEGKTQMMNKSMLEALEYAEKEILGKDYLTTFVSERDREQLSALIDEQILQGRSTINQNHIVTKNGQELLVEWQGQPFMNPEGKIDFFFGVGLDISERKKAEDVQQRISEDEIKRRKELEKLREISTSMRQAEWSGELLQVFTREVQEFIHADVVSSILYKAPAELVTFLSQDTDVQLSEDLEKEISDVLLNAKTGNREAKIPGFKSMFIFPLQSTDTMHGAVMVTFREEDNIEPDEHNMLNAISDMAGTALHRIDILETLEERVQQRTHDLVVLYNLITIISENWQLQDLLELSLVLTLETVKADRGIIYLVDGKEAPSLRPVIQRGFSDGFTVEIDSLPGDNLAWEVLKKHRPLSTKNLTDNPGYVGLEGINCFAGIPIMVRGDMRGVFSLFGCENEIFGNDEMALLASIADHIGIGIENSFLWEQSRENAALEERNRLARNLHDSVTQQLYSLTLMAGTTKKLLERDPDPETVKKSVARLGDTAHQALKEMRLLLYELRPAVLDSEGLASALQHRVETVEERLGVKVGLQAKDLPDLPSDLEDALYHIALEALNNIVKHSGSTTAIISFTRDEGKIVMEISDNGKGFDTNRPHTGLGLRNMRERGQMLGGEVEVDSTPDKGTLVRVKVNVPVVSFVES
ncbi:MAG: histidine kinase [Anaerolineales bacterium]|jgi:PAS domain S-box-containing protein